MNMLIIGLVTGLPVIAMSVVFLMKYTHTRQIKKSLQESFFFNPSEPILWTDISD